MDFAESATLGRTGLAVGRLGISSSFGAPAEAIEEAFERGCNYLSWGTFIKGRSAKMKTAIGNIISHGDRNKLVISMFTYAHNAFLTEHFLRKGLKALGIDYADVLVLGYFPKRPPQKIIDGALKLKTAGMVRYLGLSSHNRKVFPELQKEGIFDVFHIRYSAAHRGAETEAFPFIQGAERAGVVSFTATRWKRLLNPKKMPPGERPPTAPECYRFVLSNPSVDVCMMGAKDRGQMRENLEVLNAPPMTAEELVRMRRIGDHVHG
jgi:predicted aldo/keto reductase-like oxidoreductase